MVPTNVLPCHKHTAPKVVAVPQHRRQKSAPTSDTQPRGKYKCWEGKSRRRQDPVPPSSSSAPQTSLSGWDSSHLPSHVPSRSIRLSLTESSQPQEQNPQQAGLRRHGQGNHGLPWSRRSQGLRFGDAPTDRCSGCPAAGADAGTGPLIPRTALARVCVCVPVAGWGPPGDCGAGHSRGRRGRRPPGRGSRVTRRRGAILALRRPDPAASTRSGRRVGSGESWGPRSQRRSRAEERVLTSQSMPYPSPSATWARKEGQEGA